MRQLTLSDFIEHLEKYDRSIVVVKGYGNPHCYKGGPELAFENVHSVSIGEMIDMAKSCIGKDFVGCRNYVYTMEELSSLNVGKEGEYGYEMHLEQLIKMLPPLRTVSVDLRGNKLEPAFREVEAPENPFKLLSFTEWRPSGNHSADFIINGYMDYVGKEITKYMERIGNGNG